MSVHAYKNEVDLIVVMLFVGCERYVKTCSGGTPAGVVTSFGYNTQPLD